MKLLEKDYVEMMVKVLLPGSQSPPTDCKPHFVKLPSLFPNDIRLDAAQLLHGESPRGPVVQWSSH